MTTIFDPEAIPIGVLLFMIFLLVIWKGLKQRQDDERAMMERKLNLKKPKEPILERIDKEAESEVQSESDKFDNTRWPDKNSWVEE